MTNKKNLLIVISNLEFGGAQRQVVELVNHLDKDLFNISICSLSDYVPLAEQLAPEISLHVIEKKAKFDIRVVPKLAALMRNSKIDVAHSYLFDAEIATRLAGRLAGGVKVIGSERNADYRLKPIQKLTYRLTSSLVDGMIANSSSGADFNARQTGIAPEKFSVIYNGVNTGRFKPNDKAAAQKALGLDSTAPVIGMFASFKAQKNHSLLLDALEILVSRFPLIQVLLVGDMLHAGLHGSDLYCNQIRERISASEFSERIYCLGNRHDVETLYPACDFTVLPSLFEGTPNVLLESMACGVPVIASRVSDNAKLITDAVDGLLFESGDLAQLTAQITRMLESSEFTQTLGMRARKTIEDKFSSEQLAQNTARVYLA